MAVFKTRGVLTYGPGMKAAVRVDQEIANYYKALIPRCKQVQPQKYKAHVTVVRTGIDQVVNHAAWKKHEGEVVEILYDNHIHFDGRYYYLDVWSTRIGDLREELGLSRYRTTLAGQSLECYHLTVGNVKHTG